MRATLRDLARQPWRTTLTVLGITIGIFALVVFGALAEHFRAMVADSKRYVSGTIRIATKTNKAGENPGITERDREEALAIPNVRAVVPTLTLLFDGYNLEEDPLIFLSPKPLVEGVPPGLCERMRPGVRLVEGRWLAKGDSRKAMVARWLARRRGYKVGDEVPIRKLRYEVVGIYEAPDVPVIPAGLVPFDDLRQGIERPSVQEALRFFAKRKDEGGGDGVIEQLEALAEQFVSAHEERFYPHEVVPEVDAPERIRELGAALKQRLPHVAVIEPDALAKQMEKAVAIFLAITAVVSVISSVVGGLLIVNTMAMAVVERRREVAIKVAIGASTAQVAGEFLVESSLMSLGGSLAGVLLGAGAIAALDPWITSKMEVGESLFTLTPELVGGVVLYGLVLGVGAGLVPAIRAARQDPAPGLREL